MRKNYFLKKKTLKSFLLPFLFCLFLGQMSAQELYIGDGGLVHVTNGIPVGLTNGSLITHHANGTISIEAGYAAFGASDDGYIDGTVKIIGAGTTVAPVGNGGAYSPVTITTSGASDDISCSYTSATDPETTRNASLNGFDLNYVLSDTEFWTVTENSGSATDVTVTEASGAQYDGEGKDASSTPLLARWTGTDWSNVTTGNGVLALVAQTATTLEAPAVSSGATGTDLTENSGAGQTVYTTAATDNGTITGYALGGADAALLAINASGVVTLTADPDFETKSSYSFDVVVTDNHGNETTQAVTFSITDADEVDPVITSGATGTDLVENSGAGQTVYTTVATDNVAVTSYTLGGVDAALLAIDASGVVTLTADPDFETKSSYSFDVTVADAAGNTATQAVTFSITDVAETNTWTGTVDNDFSNAGNWSAGTVPTATDNIEIPANATVTITGAITANSVTIASGASLIAKDGITGFVSYSRTLTTNWHLVTSPVLGETKDDLFANHSFATGTGGDRVGIGTYDGATPKWDYATSTTPNILATGGGALDPGKGIAVKLASAGDLTFTGTFNDADVVSVAMTANQFNHLANPYASYIDAAALFTANSGNLAELTIWVWDASSPYSQYTSTNLTGLTNIAPGQSFFVNTTTGGNFNISENDQNHTANTFYRIVRPEIELIVSNGTDARKADIFYIDGTTKGFDNGYDSSIFEGFANEFAVYTRAVANGNGRNLGIQSLPQGAYESMIVPVGVNAVAGSSLEFSARSANLPAGTYVYLEDKNTNTFTRIDNATYRVTASSDLNGVGQFYIHTTSSVLAAPTNTLDNVSVYASNNETLKVEGITEGQAQVRMYSILGKQVINTTITGNGNNRVALPKLQTGVYLVEVQSTLGTLNKKLIIK